MAEESAQTVLSVLFSHILPLVSGMERQLEEGASLLDLGCGRGRALLLLAERFPSSAFLGYDLSPDAIVFATAQAAERGLTTPASSSATEHPDVDAGPKPDYVAPRCRHDQVNRRDAETGGR
jgi:methylase of polypeptide subunit release factors